MKMFSIIGGHIKNKKCNFEYKDLMRKYAKQGYKIDFFSTPLLCYCELISLSEITTDDIVKCYGVFFDKETYQSVCYNPCIIDNVIRFTQATNHGLVEREEFVDIYGTYFLFFTHPQNICER